MNNAIERILVASLTVMVVGMILLCVTRSKWAAAMVAFPLWITAALLLDGERWRRALAVSLTLLAVSTALFAGWAVAP